MNSIMKKIANVFLSIKNIIRWVPTLFKDREWDYSFMLEIEQKKLNNMIKWYEQNCYELKPQFVDDECCLEGNSFKSKKYFNFCVKTITPILMVFVLLGQIDQFFSLGWFS